LAFTVLLFLAGLVFLIAGAEALVRGASRLAAALGVSPLVIGLTIVAVGTASPEIAVSINAAASGQGDLMLGNVLGSNIFNILLILGLAAVVAPITIAEQLIRKDAPIMLGVSLFTLVLAADGAMGWLDGALLLLGLIAYTYFALRQSRAENFQVQEEYAGEFSQKETPTARRLTLNILFIAGGLGLLALGADWLVQAAVRIARALGVNELVIGLTIVAAGTSLPEAATSVIAAFKKESDIAVGNAVGSNIYNLLGVLGIGSLAARGGIPVPAHVLRFDMPVMIFVALVTLPIFFIGSRISRLEGMLFISYFALYMVYIVMEAQGSPYLPAVKSLGLFYVSTTFLVLTAAAFLSARGKTAG